MKELDFKQFQCATRFLWLFQYQTIMYLQFPRVSMNFLIMVYPEISKLNA